MAKDAIEKQRAHVIFSGRVQGVFFRAFTEDTAHTLGLYGWAKNLPDGRVEAVFEGSREAIEKAIRKCSIGPPSAHVDNVETQWKKATGEFSSFSIRHF